MTKQCILISFLALFIFESCKKEPTKKELKPSPPLIKSSPFLNGWELTKNRYNFDINPRDMFFINSTTGFVVGYSGAIYKTINSGVSWLKQNSGTSLGLFSVYFINENTGFASGRAASGCLDEDCGKGAVFLKTTDGGTTWTKKLFNDYIDIKSLHFFNESTGLALIYTPDIPNSRDYYIAKTIDGGNSWKLIDLAIQPTNDKFICVDNIVFIAGENQRIFKSTDLGDHWQTLNIPSLTHDNVRSIYFFNKNIGLIDGYTNIYKTTNGGLNWSLVDVPFSAFHLLHFYNENEVFNVEYVTAYEGGDFPTFKGAQSYQTNDDGKTWGKSELNNSIYLGLTYFPERGLGYGINFSEFYTIKRK